MELVDEKSIEVVVDYKYTNNCVICKNSLMEICYICADKKDNCGTILSKCGCIFHLHCFDITKRDTCPICLSPV